MVSMVKNSLCVSDESSSMTSEMIRPSNRHSFFSECWISFSAMVCYVLSFLVYVVI